MPKLLLCLLLLCCLVACDNRPPPVPVTATPSQALSATATVPPEATEIRASAASVVPSELAVQPSPTSPPPTILPSTSPEPETLTASPAPIQATEAYLYALSTAAAQRSNLPSGPTAAPSEFRAMGVALAEWQPLEAAISAADLETLLASEGDFASLQVAQEGVFFTLHWRDGETPITLQLRQDALNGDLHLTPVRFWRMGQPAPLSTSQPLLALIRERWLAALIPPGEFSLERLAVGENAVHLHFRIPVP